MIDAYKSFWLTLQGWTGWQKDWLHGNFSTLDPEDIEKNITNSIKVLSKCGKTFKDYPDYLKIVNQTKNEIELFKPNIPLVQSLRNPGMKERHWQKLMDELGTEIFKEKDYTLNGLLELGLVGKMDIIGKICEVAGKEFLIQSALDKMESEWKNVVLELCPYKNTGTYVCKLAEEVMRLLDDHIVMTQSMNFSPFKKFFQDRITIWDNRLRLVQELLDALLACQRNWLYLEPIFNSEDINQQLPTESKRFIAVDKSWRKIMSNAKNQSRVIEFCSDHKLLDVLKDANKTFEVVSKGLSLYLDSKRLGFPRFFFLSDDELLQILSQSKSPVAVQPHLRKCFENISKLTFGENNLISAMTSSEGETVNFSEAFYPEGNVEDWLLKVEDMMRLSIKTVLKRALVDYLKVPRKEWVQKWCGQVVIAISQMYWTIDVSEALSKNTINNLPKAMHSQLNSIIELVQGELPPISRMILGDLIVIDVHARDVVQNLVKSGVQSENDFEWMSQLRYYWQDEELLIKIVNATFRYGYEYLGNTGRLVITPLTDRCYLTLTMAMNLNMGGAPAGNFLLFNLRSCRNWQDRNG
jgi:dynein heavy chain